MNLLGLCDMGRERENFRVHVVLIPRASNKKMIPELIIICIMVELF